MPTLLQINTASNYGSTGKIVEQIGLTAKSKGWNVYVAHGPRFVNRSSLKTIQVNSSFDEKKHGFLYSLILDKHGLGSKRATSHFIKLIEQIRPDIIHLHNLHGYYLNYKILFEFLIKSKISVVWTLHDCWAMTGHCAHFDYEGCLKWKTECFNCPLTHSYPRALFIDNSRNNFLLKKKLFNQLGDRLTIVTVSSWLEKIVKQSVLGKNEVLTIYNGVDTNLFRPATSLEFRKKNNLLGKFLAVGCASPWSKKKGFYDYLDLAKIIEPDVVIVMIGLTSSQIKGLPSNIIGVERTDSIEELVSIYSTADVVLNLSYEESLGMTTIEGMACGTPSIVYNCTASPELVDERTGYVVEKGNVSQLKEKMKIIKEHSKEFYTKACRDRVLQLFDNKKQYMKYLDLYFEILNTNK